MHYLKKMGRDNPCLFLCLWRSAKMSTFCPSHIISKYFKNAANNQLYPKNEFSYYLTYYI